MKQLTQPHSQDVMIQTQLIDRGIREPRVIEAMRAVHRERFFPEAIREEAFADAAAPIGHGQTISQPYMVGLMSSTLDVQPTHRVLEIGTGSGYQTAILSKLAAEVWTIERVKPLLDSAWERLMELNNRNVHFRFGDGSSGWPKAAPFDRIIITAAAPVVPLDLLMAQLAEGGLAVLPIGPEQEQMLVRVRRTGEKLESTNISPCRFVKLIGTAGYAHDTTSRDDDQGLS